MARKKSKTKRSKNQRSFLVYVVWGLSLILLAMGSFFVGYFVAKGNTQHKTQSQHKQQLHHKEDKAKLPSPHKHEVRKELKEILSKESKYTSASHEIDDEKLVAPPKSEVVTKVEKKTTHFQKPKLAIIIDDVCTKRQIKAIKSLGIRVTMSFLPPSAARPNSAKLAAKQNFYMVHLPMEALRFNKEEPYTLHVRDSQAKILERIRDIKHLFPKVHYLNNHTGSKFTSDSVAMNRLIYALKKNDIFFVDSRTIGTTKAPQATKHYGLKYVARDVFLDHHSDKEYIKKQIQHAVALAKKRGHAIAIGHPHKNTLEALYESKELLQQVDLVRIDQIY